MFLGDLLSPLLFLSTLAFNDRSFRHLELTVLSGQTGSTTGVQGLMSDAGNQGHSSKGSFGAVRLRANKCLLGELTVGWKGGNLMC